MRDGAKLAGSFVRSFWLPRERFPGPTRCVGLPRPSLGISVARLLGFVPRPIRIDETDSAGEPKHWAH